MQLLQTYVQEMMQVRASRLAAVYSSCTFCVC
jgi:hypothetical protein